MKKSLKMNGLSLTFPYELCLMKRTLHFLPIVMQGGYGVVMPHTGKYISLARVVFFVQGDTKTEVEFEQLLTSNKLSLKRALNFLDKELPKMKCWHGEAEMGNFNFLTESKADEILRVLKDRSSVFLDGFGEKDILVFGKRPIFFELGAIKGETSSYTERSIEYPDAIIHHGDMVDYVSSAGKPVVREIHIRGKSGYPTSFVSKKRISKGLKGKIVWFVLGCDCVKV